MSAIQAGDAIFAALSQKAETLRGALAAKVDANLSGGVLQTRSGALRASIRDALEGDGATVVATIESVGVPYAAIQEYGGRTSAHVIVATKAQALRFIGPGGLAFARAVHHPGSTIPARAYLGAALDALRADITHGLKAAVEDALGGKG